MAGRVLVAGSLNADSILYVERLPRGGQTVRALRRAELPGGKGGNQAAMAGRLGAAAVAMLGCVGRDAAGEMLRRALSDCGVDIAAVAQDDARATGTAFITVEAAGENTIVIDAGANAAVTPELVHARSSAFEGVSVVVCQNEVALASTAAALRLAKANGALTIFNPAPAPELSSAAGDGEAGHLDEALASTDIVMPNESEAAVMLGDRDREFLADSDFEQAAVALQQRGFLATVVTAGARGAVLVSKFNETPQWVRPPPLQGAVRDTSGAGDCLIGAFAARLAAEIGSTPLSSDAPLLSALRYGCTAASLSVRADGCQSSYPAREAVDALLG